MNENFIVVEHIPTDVKSALETLNVLVRSRNDANLLLKMGEIQGAYNVYERTGDAATLEHIIVDIINLFNSMSSVSPVTPSPRTAQKSIFPTLNGEYRTDLIYFQSATPTDEMITVEDLINNYLEKAKSERKRFSDSTYYIYESSLKKVFADIGKRELPRNNLLNCALEIDTFVKSNSKYNHNVKTAINGFVKYILEQQ